MNFWRYTVQSIMYILVDPIILFLDFNPIEIFTPMYKDMCSKMLTETYFNSNKFIT